MGDFFIERVHSFNLRSLEGLKHVIFIGLLLTLTQKQLENKQIRTKHAENVRFLSLRTR